MTASVLTKNDCVFLASTSRAWVEPETHKAWRDLVTQQCLQGVEVIKCLDYITNVVQTQNIRLPSNKKQKKIGA